MNGGAASPAEQAWARLAPRARALLATAQAATDPRSSAQLHEVRLAAKRLRYAAEVLQPALGEHGAVVLAGLRRLQFVLGEVHDLDLRVAIIESELLLSQQELAMAASRLLADDPASDAAALALLVKPAGEQDPRPGLIAVLADHRRQRADALSAYRLAWQDLEAALQCVTVPGTARNQ